MKKAFKRKADIAPVVIISALLVLAALLTLAACDDPTGGEEVTLTFNADGGTPLPSPQILGNGAKATVPATMTKAGHIFGGWYKDAAFTTAWDFETDTVSADTVLYAKWTTNPEGTVTLTFEANGGTPAPVDQAVTNGAKATAPAVMTRSGYAFDGWHKDEACTKAWNFETDTVNADTVLYAKWMANQEGTFTLAFNANGGTPAPVDQAVANGAKAKAPAAMTRSGYAFDGWHKDEACTKAWNFETDTVSADTVLYAKWILNSLANTVWAGETPRAGDWLTISFKDLAGGAGSTIWSFSIDNTTNDWTYTYDTTAKTGTITPSGNWNPAPDGFSISADGATLTVTNYGYHGGAPRNFKRLRDNEGTVTIAPEPIATPTRLAGSVWAGETPRAGDWLTISFKDLTEPIKNSTETGLRAIWSFSSDNTTNDWGYTYDATTRAGTVTAGRWNPASNGFTISEDGTTLTIENYGGHEEGLQREFKRLRAPDPFLTVNITFDAAANSLKSSGNITLSKAGATKTATIEAVAGFGSYRWILDDNEVKGTGAELTLDAAALAKGRHHLVLVVTDSNGAPYSSPVIVVDITD